MSMRETIEVKVESLRTRHAGLKDRRYGFLVGPGTLLLGWVVLVIGIITIPLPGQGWLTTFLGVAILSLEQRWASQVLGFGVRAYDGFFGWFHRQSRTARAGVVVAGCAVIIGTFAAVFFAAYQAGWADFAEPVMARVGGG